MFKTLARVAVTALLAIQAYAQCPGCSVQTYGQGCGPTLTATLETRNPSIAELGVHYRNGNPDAIGILVIGTTQLNGPIPGTNCFVYADFVYGHFVQIDGNGSFDWNPHPWPNGNPGVVFVQMAEINRTTFADLRTTNGVRCERTN